MNTVLEVATTETKPPGVFAAAPSRSAGELTGALYKRGTSNATALATRMAARLLDSLSDLRNGPDGDALLDICIPAALKALGVNP
jgi:hypothetical protein